MWEVFQLCCGSLCSLQIFYFWHFRALEDFASLFTTFLNVFSEINASLGAFALYKIMLKQHPHSKPVPLCSKAPQDLYLFCKLGQLSDTECETSKAYQFECSAQLLFNIEYRDRGGLYLWDTWCCIAKLHYVKSCAFKLMKANSTHFHE